MVAQANRLKLFDAAPEAPVAAAHVSQLSPAERQQYQEDRKTIVVGRPTALEFLKATRERASASKTMARTRLAAAAVGRALARIKGTESWREEYPSWSAFCRGVRIGRQESYDLVNCAEVTDSLPADAIVQVGGSLTRRQVKILRKVAPEQRAQVVEEAAAAGPVDAKALEKFRLQIAPRPDDARDDDDAPEATGPERASGMVQAVRRHATILGKLFAQLDTAVADLSPAEAAWLEANPFAARKACRA